MVLAPEQLRDRCLRSERSIAQVPGEDPVPEEAHRLHLRVAPGQAVTDDRIPVAAVFAREIEQPIELRPEHDRVDRGFLAPLVPEQGHGDGPTRVDVADDVRGIGARVGEEDLVELLRSVEHRDRPDLDAGLVERAQEERQALVLRSIGIGAGEQEDPARLTRPRRPDLLTVDDPLVAVEHRTGGRRTEIGARVRFREPLAPAVLAREDARQEVPLLCFGAPSQERVASHLETERVAGDPRGHTGLGELLGEDHLLELGKPAAAVLRRPCKAEHSVLVEGAAPVLRELPRCFWVEVTDPLPVVRELLREEGSDLVAKQLGLGRVVRIHGSAGSQVSRIAGCRRTLPGARRSWGPVSP